MAITIAWKIRNSLNKITTCPVKLTEIIAKMKKRRNGCRGSVCRRSQSRIRRLHGESIR